MRALVVAFAWASSVTLSSLGCGGEDGVAGGTGETGVKGCDLPPPGDPKCYVCLDGAWRLGSYPGTTNPACGTPPPPECPATAPAVGNACWSLLDCAYADTCTQRPPTSDGMDHFTCDFGTGRWMISNAYALTTCPPSIPSVGSPCGCGRHFYASCEYAGDCSIGLGDAIAVCNHDTGSWMLERASCPGFDADSIDADTGDAPSDDADASP